MMLLIHGKAFRLRVSVRDSKSKREFPLGELFEFLNNVRAIDLNVERSVIICNSNRS